MKLLFLSAANSIHTVRWVNSLVEKNIEVYLVSLKNHFEDDRNPISKKVKIIYLPINGIKGYYLNYIFLKNLIKKLTPDIVNAHYLSGYGTLARLVNFQNTLVNVWGSDIYDFPQKNIINKKIIQKNILKIKYIASTSNVMANEIKKYLKKEKQIKITPFGIDTKVFVPGGRNESNDSSNEIVIGIVKTLREKYGIEYLIRAFGILIKSNKNKKLRLVIYGEGELKNYLEGLCRELEISNFVEFKGYISNELVAKALTTLDIFVVPSIYESFGVSAVEAMSCEIPVVASDADGFTEVIENEITGFIVPQKNEEELAKKIQKLIDDKNLRYLMGKKARNRVKKKYEWNKNVDKMIEIYEEIINEGK